MWHAQHVLFSWSPSLLDGFPHHNCIVLPSPPLIHTTWAKRIVGSGDWQFLHSQNGHLDATHDGIGFPPGTWSWGQQAVKWTISCPVSPSACIVTPWSIFSLSHWHHIVLASLKGEPPAAMQACLHCPSELTWWVQSQCRPAAPVRAQQGSSLPSRPGSLFAHPPSLSSGKEATVLARYQVFWWQLLFLPNGWKWAVKTTPEFHLIIDSHAFPESFSTSRGYQWAYKALESGPLSHRVHPYCHTGCRAIWWDHCIPMYFWAKFNMQIITIHIDMPKEPHVLSEKGTLTVVEL